MRLMLGTANWGRDYGLTGRGGGVELSEARGMWRVLNAAGGKAVDTAAAYGSEELVGEVCRGRALVVTKLDPEAVRAAVDSDAQAIRSSVLTSLARLRVDRVHGLLLHDTSPLARPGGRQLARNLSRLVDEGLADRVGVSIYSPDELELIPPELALGFVQLPLNLLDQRFHATGLIGDLQRQGVQVAARSVFLQGLLSAVELASRLPPDSVRAVAGVRAHAAQLGVEPGELAIRFALACEPDFVVVGANSPDQLAQVIEWSGSETDLGPDVAALAIDDPEVIDPRRWKWAR